MKNFKTARSLYNNIYKNYHDNRDKATNDVSELPTVLELLGDLQDKKVLDIGCGLGRHSKEFIKRGAIVTGFDSSEKMITLTKKLCKNKGEFFRADYEKVSFKQNSFDAVNASLSLNYSKNPERVIKNISSWLRIGGIFTFSIPHPIWLLPKQEKMDYSKPHKIWIKMGSYDVEIFNYYHPLSVYVRSFENNNLRLLDMVETTVGKRYKGWREDKYRLPIHIVFKLEKV